MKARKIEDHELETIGQFFDNALKSKEDADIALEYFKALQFKYRLKNDETINTRTGRIIKFRADRMLKFKGV